MVFEVVSPSELKAWRERDVKRAQLQDTLDVREIVELYQTQMAAHIYRKGADGSWMFESIGGADAVLALSSVAVSFPLAEIYQFTDLARPEAS